MLRLFHNMRQIFLTIIRRKIKEAFKMEEKVYKTMGSTGGLTLAVGICILVGGIASGIVLIVNGARLLKDKSKLVF